MAKKTRKVEVYYGYYMGESRLWDTSVVEIPADTPEDAVERTAERRFLDTNPDVTFAFVGIFNSDAALLKK
jgi:hypothetical protein